MVTLFSHNCSNSVRVYALTFLSLHRTVRSSNRALKRQHQRNAVLAQYVKAYARRDAEYASTVSALQNQLMRAHHHLAENMPLQEQMEQCTCPFYYSRGILSFWCFVNVLLLSFYRLRNGISALRRSSLEKEQARDLREEVEREVQSCRKDTLKVSRTRNPYV